ncbi:5-dehydro-4-deoxyglucarate dehydratase [Streptomyces abyssomicinicus]|uniref:5-dehydro-4-deoxyglucarate dehydratase n=1 Tax=Streptomyces abyssomicinicus TaxID=574929 RepID=UPI0012503F27|nr:5-dehydro-4-deoxyglucarate dehydratase [Streptomyces abyssomicinicus]
MFDGVLFFPVTPFTASGAIDRAALAEHVGRGLDAGPGGVFAACGTGEFHALDPEEYGEVVSTAVETAAGRVPVFAGTGGPLPLARRFSRIAQEAGADGLLLLPPYLVESPAAGLVAYTRQVAAASDLPVIVYNRSNARFTPDAAAEVARMDRVVGFKDGVGDLDRLSRTVLAVRSALAGSGKPFQFFNGMPTAEVTVPAYRGIGVELYSSAVFCFAPEISHAFHRAVTTGDQDTTDLLLREFFHPLVSLRDKVPGYAVSLIKAGIALRGHDVGGVRPPLTDPAPQHLERLRRIIDAGLEIVERTGKEAGR